MVATVVTHMMISLNSHVGRASNQNSNFKKVATIQQFENVTEVKYKSVIEQEQQPPAGAQFYQFNLNESAITISETSLTRVKKAIRTINESTTAIGEALVHKGAHTITEPATSITEGITKLRKAPRTITEPATSIGESLLKSTKRVKTITESATAITEGLVSNRHFTKTLTPESTAITEALVSAVKKVRHLIETPTDISESLIHLKAAVLTEPEITITESLISSRVFSFTLSEQSFTSPSFTLNSFLSTLPITERLTAKPIRQLSEVTPITESLTALRIVNRIISENVTVGLETLHKLVNHVLTESVAITESLIKTLLTSKPLNEDPIAITESLTIGRLFRRTINPVSFTDESFTTGLFETFRPPISDDAVVITEELEAVVLGEGQKVINEPPTIITESLVALKIPALVVTPPSGGGRRRRRQYLPLYQRRQPVPELEKPREPILYQFELTEPATQITEALSSTKIITQIQTKIQTISVAAAVPPPQIIEKLVYVDKIVEKEKLVQPPPIIRAQDVIVSKSRPIEVEQEILVSTQSHSNKMKSKAASAQLQILRELMILSELEEMV